jgi:hypothetical protein
MREGARNIRWRRAGTISVLISRGRPRGCLCGLWKRVARRRRLERGSSRPAAGRTREGPPEPTETQIGTASSAHRRRISRNALKEREQDRAGSREAVQKLPASGEQLQGGSAKTDGIGVGALRRTGQAARCRRPRHGARPARAADPLPVRPSLRSLRALRALRSISLLGALRAAGETSRGFPQPAEQEQF